MLTITLHFGAVMFLSEKGHGNGLFCLQKHDALCNQHANKYLLATTKLEEPSLSMPCHK